MLLLTSTSDILNVITSAAGQIDVHASWIDLASGAVSAGRTNTKITTAATTTIVASPAASTSRNVKQVNIGNDSGSVTNTVTLQHSDGTNVIPIESISLAPGERFSYVEGNGIRYFDTLGREKIADSGFSLATAKSVASQSPAAATDTYITNSSLPLGTPLVGTSYQWRMDITKTAVGTATPIFNVRVGTAGTTGDTSRATLTFGAGTAVVDTAVVTITATFRTVGSGTSAVLVVQANADCLPATGWSSTTKAVVAVSSGFDSTVAGSVIGLSYNSGTSGAHTLQQIEGNVVQY